MPIYNDDPSLVSGVSPLAVEPSGSEGGGQSGGDWIGALIGLSGMLINNYQQKKMASQQNAWNKENALDAYNRDLEQWNRQNAYNSPQSQMERWKAAGLNPNLIYGGSSSGGNASSSPSARVPGVVPVPGMLNNPAQIMSVLGGFQDFRMRQAQIDNVKAQTDNVQSRTFNESLRSNLMDIQGQSIYSGMQRANMKLNYDKARWLQEYEQREVMNPIQEQKALFDLSSARSMLPYKLEGIAAQSASARAGVQKTLSSIGLMNQQQQLNMLRMHAMRQNLTTGKLSQEKMIADTVLKNYQSQYHRGGAPKEDKMDSGVLNVLIRALSSMF